MSSDSTALATVTHLPTAQAQIATGPPTFAQPRTLAEVKQFGEMMLASGFFKDVKSVAQACVKITAGLALGYDVTTAMNAFHIIEGKIAPTAGEIAARIKRSGKYNYRVPVINDTEVSIVFLERDGDKWMELGTSTFNMQDAVKAGVASKDVWKKYPRNMLFSRALTNGARWFVADVFGGPVYTAEELGANVDVDAEGEIIILDPVPPQPKAVAQVAPTGAMVKAAYADLRGTRPELPEDVKVWVSTWLTGYDGKTSKDQLIVIMAKIMELAAEGVDAPTTPAEPQETAQDASFRPVPTEKPAEYKYDRYGPPPAHNGVGITNKTRGHLMGNVAKLGYAEKRDRLGYAEQNGLSVGSYNELSEEQGQFLAQRAWDDFMATQPCAACNAQPGDAHATGCPEAPEAM